VTTGCGPAPSSQPLASDWCCHGDRGASNYIGRALAPLSLEGAGPVMNGFSQDAGGG
jgi:hypothetical protein